MENHSGKDRRRTRRRGILARFGRDREGATVIEFALLATPFALLVFAILESCVSYAAQEVMANATDNVARRLRTGQLLAQDVDEATIKQMICNELSIIVANGCPGLMVDLRSFTTFEDAAKASFTIINGDIVLTKNGTKDEEQFVTEAGPAMSKNMLRVFYKWPVMTDFMAKSMANLKGGATLHFASTVWQNEPFN
jgi:Flp pilus assembly protein TadG